MDIIESLLIGIVSGIISSFIITQIYRQIDKKHNRFDYINELLKFIDSFQNVLYRSELEEIEDEYVEKLYHFVWNNVLPPKNRWVKLRGYEKKTCKAFIIFYGEVMKDILLCHTNMQNIQKGETQYMQDVKNIKVQICTVRLMELLIHRERLFDMRSKFIR